jgi:hypothetical protein
VQRQEGRSGLGTHLAHEHHEDRVAALVAALLELLENLLSRVIVLFQQADDLPLKGIELAGTLGSFGFLKTLPARPFAHRVQAEFEFAGNLPQPKALFSEQVPNLAIGLIIDHS